MTAPAEPHANTTALDRAAPRRVLRRQTGRAVARRFVCPPDPAWPLFHDAACALGGLAAMHAVTLQLVSMLALATHWAWLVTGMASTILAGLAARRWRAAQRGRQASARVSHASPASPESHASRGSDVLRWDTQQWWWQSTGTHASVGAAAGGWAAGEGEGDGEGTGAPLATSPQVLLDLEHWMLLRLIPAGTGARFWRQRLVAVSRRHHAGDWSLLRIHLFMARA